MDPDFSPYQEFDWDEWNIRKNLLKHKVAVRECEEAFSDSRKLIISDSYHSNKEDRYILIGSTTQGRVLYIAFTIRKQRIRVISARDLNRKERYLYP